MIAQLSTSVSDDQIRLIIVALLVVAVLLALLTTWYAVRTSPRRRVRVAQVRRGTAAGRTPGAPAAGRPATPGSSAAAPGSPPRSGLAPEPDRSAGGGRSEPAVPPDDDEWTRLTAPQQQRFPNG